jgi:hypothetical protein
MTALYTALLESETKEKLALMVCELREENARLQATLLQIKRDNQHYNFGSKLMRIVDAALHKEPA